MWYSRTLKVSGSLTNASLFFWAPWNWLDLNSSSLWSKKQIFGNFLLLIIDFRANGEQLIPRHSSFCEMVLLYDIQMWDSWSCYFSAEVRVKQRPGSTLVHRCLKQFLQLSLLAGRAFTLGSSFLYLTTRWRQFCSQDRLSSSCLPWCTEILTNPNGCGFRVRESVRAFHLFFVPKCSQMLASLVPNTLSCWISDQVSHPLLFCWTFLMHSWILCLSQFQVYNLRGNGDMNTTPFWDSYDELR